MSTKRLSPQPEQFQQFQERCDQLIEAIRRGLDDHGNYADQCIFIPYPHPKFLTSVKVFFVGKLWIIGSTREQWKVIDINDRPRELLSVCVEETIDTFVEELAQLLLQTAKEHHENLLG